MQNRDDLLLEGLTMASEIIAKTDELAEIVCKVTDEHHQKVDEFMPRSLAQRIAAIRAKQNTIV